VAIAPRAPCLLHDRGRAAIAPVADEGFVRRAVTQPAADPEQPPPPGTEVYVHEALCSWPG
jgi:hypothetical protein